jgi:hypothetical protein
MLDPEVHEEINAGLRQSLADCMPKGTGGIVAVWYGPEQPQVAHASDLGTTYAEHRSAGLGVTAALGALATEIRADERGRPDPRLVGIGLVGHAPVEAIGLVASLLAVIDFRVHQIVWPHAQAVPTWEIKQVDEVDDEDCATYVAALCDLLDALTGQVEGGAR